MKILSVVYCNHGNMMYAYGRVTVETGTWHVNPKSGYRTSKFWEAIVKETIKL